MKYTPPNCYAVLILEETKQRGKRLETKPMRMEHLSNWESYLPCLSFVTIKRESVNIENTTAFPRVQVLSPGPWLHENVLMTSLHGEKSIRGCYTTNGIPVRSFRHCNTLSASPSDPRRLCEYPSLSIQLGIVIPPPHLIMSNGEN